MQQISSKITFVEQIYLLAYTVILADCSPVFLSLLTSYTVTVNQKTAVVVRFSVLLCILQGWC